jgi:dipeptidyl-peptidase-4
MSKRFLLLWLCAAALHAGAPKRLTFEQAFLMRGEPLLRLLPAAGPWLDDGAYAETRDGKAWRVDARSGRARLLFDPAPLKGTGPKDLDWLQPADHSADWSSLVYLHGDDLYAYRRSAGRLARLTATSGAEQNPLLSPDGRRVAYTLGGDLYSAPLDGGEPVRLTRDGGDDILNGYASWVYYEEILGRASRYRAFEWSPDGRTIAFMRFDQSPVPRFPLFDAAGAYGRLEMQRYPKPGFPNPIVKVGFVGAAGGEISWVDFAGGGDHYLTFLDWAPRGDRAFVQWLNRGQDELRLYECEPTTGKARLVYTEKQKAWVDFLDSDSFVPLADGGALLLSSKSGWTHVYRLDADGRERALTRGEWSVSRIDALDEGRRAVCFSADREDSTRSDLYRVGLDGGAPVRLTREGGSHRASVSPRGSFFIDRWSTRNRPAVLDLCGGDGRLVRRLGDSAAPAFAQYGLGKSELFRIPAADGLKLPAAWILPPGFDPSAKYPVVLSIYGGPGARGVLDAFPRRLDGHYLAQEGIIVLAVDHRGSGHFGKSGEERMHRCLGRWEMADYGSAVDWLRTLPFVDGARIGIEGGSYGGYVAALAVVSDPGRFACGIAEYSVTDWALYDSVYAERYMDTPQENPDGYRQSSVLSRLDSYRGNLRLTHGSMDDNVHLQNSLQLLDRLLDLGQTVELMIYPGERHGVRGRKAAENARSALEFWRKHFFPERVGPVGPVRQEKEE